MTCLYDNTCLYIWQLILIVSGAWVINWVRVHCGLWLCTCTRSPTRSIVHLTLFSSDVGIQNHTLGAYLAVCWAYSINIVQGIVWFDREMACVAIIWRYMGFYLCHKMCLLSVAFHIILQIIWVLLLFCCVLRVLTNNLNGINNN